MGLGVQITNHASAPTRIAAGNGISEDDILSATFTVQSLYGNDTAAMRVYDDLANRPEEKSE